MILKVFDLESIKVTSNISAQSVISAESPKDATFILSEEAKRSTINTVRGIFDHYKPDIIGLDKPNPANGSEIKVKNMLAEKEMQPSLGYVLPSLSCWFISSP